MKSLYKNLFSSLLKLRMTENEIAKKYSEQEMRCPVHLSIGQEAAAVGVCANLDLQIKCIQLTDVIVIILQRRKFKIYDIRVIWEEIWMLWWKRRINASNGSISRNDA